MNAVSPRSENRKEATEKQERLRRGGEVATLVAAILLGIILLFVLISAIRVGFSGWQAYRSGTAILSTLQTDRSPAALVTLEPEVKKLAGALENLEGTLRPAGFLFRGLGGLPTYGGTVAAIPELLVIGSESTAIAVQGLEMVGPSLEAETIDVENTLQLLAGQEVAFEQMAQRALRIEEALLTIEPTQLLPQLTEPIALAQELAPLMGPALQMGPVLPDLLGFAEPITYLVLVQNNHELRPTGGFISGVGELTLSRARVQGLEFFDSYAIDNHEVDHPPAPQVLQQYMQTELLFLRDANWSPDLPTSARTIHTLYKQDRGVLVDGVVTIDLRAVELIVDAIGPLEIDGIDYPITGQNIVDVIQQLWSSPVAGESLEENSGEWWAQRKDFMPIIASVALQKIQSGRFNYFALVRAARQALAERAVQVWLDDPVAAARLHEWGWDGALFPLEGADFVALLDSNLGYNKVNAVVTRALEYRISWPLDGQEGALAEATVRYEHPLEVPDHECDQTPRYGESYAEMMRRCYFNYVRLYVPRGSTLVEIEGVDPDSVSSRPGEAGTQLFAGFFTMMPGTEKTVTFRYRLPPSIVAETYRVLFQRQSGSGPLPLRWTMRGRTYTATLRENILDWSAP